MKTRLIWLMTLLWIVFPLVAQDGEMTTYTDPNGFYTAPIPDGWSHEANGNIVLLLNPSADVSLFLVTVDADTNESALEAGIALTAPDVGEPVQTVPAPLPNGEWLQNTYVVESDIVVAIAQARNGQALVIVGRGEQAAITQANSDILGVITGVEFGGEAPTVDIPYVNPDSFTESEVTFGVEGWELPATLTTPNGDGPFPAVVLVHGSGPNDRDQSLGGNKPFRDIAWGLATNEIVVLRYDKRTFVYQQELAIVDDLTIDDETVDDAVAGVAYLQDLSQVDANQIYVIGSSWGAWLAPRIAEQGGDIVAGIGLLAGFSRPFDDVLREQIDYLTELDPSVAEAPTIVGLEQVMTAMQTIRDGGDASELLGNQLAYWMSVVDYDPLMTAQSLSIPMLILQGERDYQVTMEDYLGWQDVLLERDNVHFKSYFTLNHLFLELGDTDRLAIPADYLTETGFVDAEVIRDLTDFVQTGNQSEPSATPTPSS